MTHRFARRLPLPNIVIDLVGAGLWATQAVLWRNARLMCGRWWLRICASTKN